MSGNQASGRRTPEKAKIISPPRSGVDINSIRDVHTPQPGEIVFKTMTYRSRLSETVQRSGYIQSSVSYIKLQIMFRENKI